MTFDLADIERRLRALENNRGASLRFGTVTEVNAAGGSARIQLDDGGGMVSHPLRVLSDRVLKDKRQTMPDLQEPVAVLFSGQGMEQGVILGATYTEQTPSPGKPAGQDYTIYEDGTEIWYDRESHKLIAKVKGDIEVETEGHAILKAKGDVRVETESAATVAAMEEVSVSSAVSITLAAPLVFIKGLLRLMDLDGKAGSGELLGTYTIKEGSLHVPDGDSTAGNVSLRQHPHNGVQSGSGTTGPPVGGG